MSAPSESAADLILAVDAGGTKTVACIARAVGSISYEILGRGRADGANPLSVGFDRAVAAVAAATTEAASEAKLAGAPVARAVLSIAGAANPDVASEIARRARAADLAERIDVVSDVLPILAAASDGACVALIAGTGSVAVGRDERGRTIRCGGWGYLLGDDGSGFAIGRAALRFALEDLESGNAELQKLTTMMLNEFGAESTSDLAAAIHADSNPRSVIASLAVLVGRAAEAGDPDARRILDKAAGDLASLAKRVAETLGLDLRTTPVALAGGVLVGSQYLREAFAAQLSATGILPTVRLIADPLAGCLKLAAAR